MNYIEATTRTQPPIIEEMLTEEITQLSIDHPGAHDADYRARRDFIARLARDYRECWRQGATPVIPVINYTEEETGVWRYVYDELEEAHRRRACSLYLEAKRKLGISRDEI